MYIPFPIVLFPAKHIQLSVWTIIRKRWWNQWLEFWEDIHSAIAELMRLDSDSESESNAE